MDEGYVDDKGGRRWGGKGGGRPSGRATTVVAASIANEFLVANLGKIADKQRAAPVVVAPPGGGEGWWGIRIHHHRLVLILQSAVVILGMNVSLYILNYHSRLHFHHPQRLHMLVPHQFKQVFVVELVRFAFHLVLNHFCAQN